MVIAVILIIFVSMVFGGWWLAKRRRKPKAAPDGELNPPVQEEVVKRALCLGALQLRVSWEHIYLMQQKELVRIKADPETYGQKLAASNEKALKDLDNFIAEKDLLSYFSTKEKALFAKPPGSWSEQELIDAGWRIEALATLLWALSLLAKIPPYDQEADPQNTLDLASKLHTSHDYKLRSIKELAKARDIAEHWNWRARTTLIMQQGNTSLPKGETFSHIIEVVAQQGYEQGMNPKPIDNDFPAFNKPYRDLTESEYHSVNSIAIERHFALNWLNGYAENWDETPTDT